MKTNNGEQKRRGSIFWKKVCSWILYDLGGWKLNVTVPMPDKCVICIAPHTSNWDFFLAILYRSSAGFRSQFFMKKELFFWPLGSFMRAIGGIPINRAGHFARTDTYARLIRMKSNIHIGITPEGTRSYNAYWKKGGYYIAYKAKVPVLLYGIDYKHKLIVCTKQIIPCGDINVDGPLIKGYYTAFEGLAKYPEKFAHDAKF